MPVKAIVVSESAITAGGKVVRERELMGSGEHLSLELGELVSAVLEPLRRSIQQKAEVTLEVSAALTFQGSGGVNWAVFNVGGTSSSSNTAKVVVKTEITPGG